MRSLSDFFDTRFKPSFLRTTAAKNPRTECCCHPVAFMMVAMSVPCGRCSISITRSCLEMARLDLDGRWSFSSLLFFPLPGCTWPDCLGTKSVGLLCLRRSTPRSSRFAAVDRTTGCVCVSVRFIGILRSICDGVLRRHHRSPAQLRKPAGQKPLKLHSVAVRHGEHV